MELSQTIRRVESEIDQAITEGIDMPPENVAALLEAMQHWACQAADLENQLAVAAAEVERLRGLLKMPEGLGKPGVCFDNVVPMRLVPVVGRVGDEGGAA